MGTWKNYPKDQIEKVSRSFNGLLACRCLGIEVRKNSILCPNPAHNDTHFGSCVYNPRNGKFVCYSGCNGKAYSGIDIVRFNLGCSFQEAVEYAADQVGAVLTSDESAPVPKKDLAPTLSEEEMEALGMEPSVEVVKIPVGMTDDREEAYAHGSYEEDVTHMTGDVLLDDHLYILCDTVTNPYASMRREDPVAWCAFVIWHIDARCLDFRRIARSYRDAGDITVFEYLRDQHNLLVIARKRFYRYYREHTDEPLYPQAGCADAL